MLWTGRVTKEEPLQLDPHFDLRITSAVLGKSAKKDQRYFLNCSIVDFPSEESVTAPLCSLSLGANENISLDISIDAGEPVGFTADTEIFLFGYYMETNDMGFPEEDSEDEEFQPLDMSLESVDEPESDDSIENEPRVEILEDNILNQVKQRVAGLNKRKEPPTSPNSTPNKKQKVTEEQKSPEPSKNQKKETPKQQAKETQQKAKETPQKGGKKEQQNTPKGKEEKPATPQAKQTPPQQKGAAQSPKDNTTPQKGKQTPTSSPGSEKKLKGGLVIQTVAPSTNPKKAAAGNKVKVQYSGRLQSNQKQFDQGTFSFQLGAGKVIKGWDMGIAGMAVGERRKLIIPPNLAYGPKGMDGDIPPNATLEFDVTLMSVQ